MFGSPEERLRRGLGRFRFRRRASASDRCSSVEPKLACESLERRDLLTLPPGFSIETYVGGLNEPIAMAFAPDGRIFVAEKAGRVRVVSEGSIVDTFIDLRDEVNSKHDRGLIGIALDPHFATNRRVYLNFTQELRPDIPDSDFPAGGSLIRVDALATNPNVADLATRVTLLTGHDNYSITHSVGDIDFDQAGNLVFSWGDGGFLDSLRHAAQNPDSKQGKIFRIDPVSGAGVPGNPYYDPANPSSVRSQVLALGIRNAWRMSQDPATGNIYFGDVTDGGPEEINVIRPIDLGTPLNFGWPYYEGRNRTSYGAPPAGFVSTYPYVSYNHIGSYDAITNGVVFRGNKYPSTYDGRFFFANFGQDVVYSANDTGVYTEFGRNEWAFPVDIHLGPNGRLQFASIVNGTLYELVHNSFPTGRPRAVPSVVSQSGLTVSFNAASSTDPNGDPLNYAWDFDQDGRVDSTLAAPSFTYSEPGTYLAQLTVVDPAGNSHPGTVQFQVAVQNIAVGKPATQSSTAFNEAASRAVDGSLTTGHSSTESESQAWWQVDLLSTQSIGQIVIYNNTEFPERLSNYHVMVADTPFTSSSLGAALNNADWSLYDPGSAGLFRVVNVGQRGRYVRIQLVGTNYLSLREVRVYLGPTGSDLNDSPLVQLQSDKQFVEATFPIQFSSAGTSDPNGDSLAYEWIFGDGQKSKLANPANTYVAAGRYTVRLTVTDSRGARANKTTIVHVLPKLPLDNLAIGKPSAQSTTAYGGVSSRAVDGNESGDHARKKSVSHTALQRQPFWEVDLGDVYDLSRVILFNRTDVGPNKLGNAWILTSTTPFTSGNLDAVRSTPGTWGTLISGLLGSRREIELNQTARYLRIQLAGDNAALALAEVVVLGQKAPSFRYNQHTYRLTSQPLTWADARAEAIALGGHLVAIDDANENQFLMTAFGPETFHTDLTDQYIEGNFGWENDQIFGFANWEVGGPSDPNGSADFGTFRGVDGKWSVGRGDELRYGIIEIGPPLPNQFYYFDGKVYGLTQTILSWQDSRDEALAKGGDLVQIESQSENNWLRSVFRERYYFTGLQDSIVEGSFRWADGTAASFTSFASGEPNDADGTQDAVIFSGDSGLWFDWSASYAAYAIIEYDV